VGYDILKFIEFPFPIDKIVLQHHERIDGSGYPQGLTHNNTLLESKILAVADVVEAIASHRPYRPALGIDKALQEITQKRGIHYDAQAVDACLKVLADKSLNLLWVQQPLEFLHPARLTKLLLARQERLGLFCPGLIVCLVPSKSAAVMNCYHCCPCGMKSIVRISRLIFT